MYEKTPATPIGLTLDEAVTYLGLNYPTFWNLVKAGLLPNPIDVADTQIWKATSLSRCFNRLEERYSKARERVIATYDVI